MDMDESEFGKQSAGRCCRWGVLLVLKLSGRHPGTYMCTQR